MRRLKKKNKKVLKNESTLLVKGSISFVHEFFLGRGGEEGV